PRRFLQYCRKTRSSRRFVACASPDTGARRGGLGGCERNARSSRQLGGLPRQVVPVTRAYARSESMKVLDALPGVASGDTVSVAELGLPVAGGHGLLLVFWKST